MTVGGTIKKYRKEKGFTQSELAELLGVTVQAVSKWETDTGMPDISQIIPLARVLEISTDKLLGYTDAEFLKEAEKIRDKVRCRINLITEPLFAKELYEESYAFFDRHPDVPDIALICLECFIELVSQKAIEKEKQSIMEECERYLNAILRFDTDADRIHKAYCLMSRAYDLLGESEKSQNMLSRLPLIFGDRTYWEAEIAYANGHYDLALKKIKESFTVKARFIPRCIRLANRIAAKTNTENITQISAELGEYMLRIIDAFLSGGEHIPYRQMGQKTSLLVGLVSNHINLGNHKLAKYFYNELVKTRDEFFAFLDDPKDKHCLMFVENNEDGIWGATKEIINERVAAAEKLLRNNSDKL